MKSVKSATVEDGDRGRETCWEWTVLRWHLLLRPSSHGDCEIFITRAYFSRRWEKNKLDTTAACWLLILCFSLLCVCFYLWGAWQLVTRATICQQVAPRILDDSNLSCDHGLGGKDSLVKGLRHDQKGEWDFSHLKEIPPIISRLKGRVLRLCFYRLWIHYCFSFIPSERRWQMKFKYAADIYNNKRHGSYLQRSACCSGSVKSCREML